MFQGFLSVWPEISSPSMNFDLGGKSVPALNIILSPLWNLPIASSAYDRALDNLPSVFTAIYEDWNSMTTGMTESAHCWPSLRTMLAPYFQIRDSYITSEHLPDHPTRPELGDVVYVDYPCNFPATLVTNASNYTVICNIATEIWEACNFRADADIEDSFEAPKTNKGEVLSWGFSFTDGYPTSFESTVHYDEAFPSIKTRTTPNPVHAYLSHNLEDIVTGCTGHISSGHCSVRRVFFMVTAVEHRQRYTLEARRTESPTSAIRRTSSNSHLLFHDSPYVFHRNPTETAHIDADSDTPKPWGHWSTSKDCTQGEYVIPAAPNKDAFEAMPGVELDGFRVKALAFPESERCRYKFHIFHELIIS
ncbi:hypothetical protein PLICRDRAFT_58182 [Plicaturopsis crispa FD-325 SS-3]|uniref:Uncharacterized protein n=1 Tax=Plicaturopsis crispa FD-325 SS-3 TaxID=944288 RepID=A0A0C9SQG1_PLICR|nr:hypothetical protein PLICRDRAFT_58182 [Plicaturopsis crispa FD-325 SS-3]